MSDKGKHQLRKIIAYQDGAEGQCEEAIRKIGGTVRKKLSLARALVCTLPDDKAVNLLRSLPCIKRIDDDTSIRAIQD